MAVHEAISTQITRWGHDKQINCSEAYERAIDCIKSSPSQRSGLRDWDETDESLIGTAIDHIDRFLRYILPQFRSCRYICHEKLDSFSVGDTNVWVRPDLCYRDGDGQFVITDWKTRRREAFESPTLQLQTYALWAREKFEPDIDQVRLQLAFTSTGDILPQLVSEADLEATRERINSDTEAWQNLTQQSSFPTDPAVEKCRSCSYLYYCPEGKRMVDQ